MRRCVRRRHEQRPRKYENVHAPLRTPAPARPAGAPPFPLYFWFVAYVYLCRVTLEPECIEFESRSRIGRCVFNLSQIKSLINSFEALKPSVTDIVVSPQPSCPVWEDRGCLSVYLERTTKRPLDSRSTFETSLSPLPLACQPFAPSPPLAARDNNRSPRHAARRLFRDQHDGKLASVSRRVSSVNQGLTADAEPMISDKRSPECLPSASVTGNWVAGRNHLGVTPEFT
ncbi:hypothetical protein EVAR_36075_1 [Eumeta japonica]|uniref:Uncharacterized protein n=1 Tax=Eumeta variegata TaxID=151549 RepID=A0A4C1YIJ5_EUMVA|nr:hypothetical protein EVAR_36075_1 [Eumeta japonica]